MKFLRKWWDSGLLVLVALLLASLLRFQGLEGSYIRAFDPFLFWRVSEAIWNTGTWEMNDTLRYHPFGWDSEELAPAPPHAMVLLGKVAGDLKAGVRWFPAFFGLLSVLVMALIGRRFGVSGLSALILGILPGYIYRTSEGFADKEPIAMFFGLLGMYFFILAMEKKNWLDAIYAGLAFGFVAGAWGGKILFIASLLPVIVVLMLRERYDRILMAGVTLVIYQVLHVVVPRYVKFWVDPFSLAVLGFGLFCFLFYGIYKSKKLEKLGNKRLWLCIGIMVAGTLVASTAVYKNPLFLPRFGWDLITKALVPASDVSHYETVQENARPTWSWALPDNTFYQQMGLFFFLALPAIYFMINGKDDKEVVLGSFGAFSILAGFVAVRLFAFTATGVALTSAYVIKKLFAHKDVAVKLTGYFVLGLSLWLAYPYVMSSMETSKYASLTTTWFENMKWAQFNIPQEDPIVTWWDYGYWIQTLGNRTSLGDGGNMEPGYILNGYTGLFFASGDYENTTRWINDWGYKYVTIDYAMLGKYFAYSTLGGVSNMLNIFKYHSNMYTEFGMADIYVGWSDDLGPAAISPIQVGDNLYVLMGKIVNGAIKWEGVAGEFAILTNSGLYQCPPMGYCQSGALGKYQPINQSVFIYWGQQAVVGDMESMHSTFARLWFFDGEYTQYKQVLNNGECKMFVVRA